MYPARPSQQHLPQSLGNMSSRGVGPPLPPGPRPAATPPTPATPSQHHPHNSQGGMSSGWTGPPLPPGPRPTTPPPTPTTRSHHPTLPQPNTHVHGHPSNHVTPLISIKPTEKPTNTATITSFVHTSTAPPHTSVVVSSVFRSITSTNHDNQPPHSTGKTLRPIGNDGSSGPYPKIVGDW